MAIFNVGTEYSRRDVANVLGEERIALSREGPVYLQPQGLALLFVTLNKAGRADNLKYNDWFEGRNFHWDSQTTQHYGTPRIQDMVSGRLEVWLFARINDRDDRRAVEPFVCAGRLQYVTHDEGTANPVHVVWQCVDYRDDAPNDLQAIYAWRPQAALSASRPTLFRIDRQNRQRGQGFIADSKVRKAVELRAMALAKEWYGELGFTVEDTSKNRPYDLRCTRDADVRRVEVKGTMGGGDHVWLTRGEVSAAEETNTITDLFIVSNLSVERTEESAIVSGGDIDVILGWLPSRDDLTALQFEYRVPRLILESGGSALAHLKGNSR